MDPKEVEEKEQELAIIPRAAYARKKAREALEKAGLKVPKELKSRIIHKVNSKIGSIAVRDDEGVVPSGAATIVKQFEKNLGGKTPLLEALVAHEGAGGKLTDAEKLLMQLLGGERAKRVQLARLIAEAGANPAKVMDLYTKGMIQLKKTEAIRAAAEEMPQLVKNLIAHAASEAGDICSLCAGTGEVGQSAITTQAPAAQKPCPVCDRTGRKREPSELKKFALEKLLEINKLVEKGPMMVQQQQNIQVAVEGGQGSILEKIRRAADEVTYKREEVVEAEVVSSTTQP